MKTNLCRKTKRTICIILAFIIVFTNIYFPIVVYAQNDIGEVAVGVGSYIAHEAEKIEESQNDATSNSVNDWQQAFFVDGIPWNFFHNRVQQILYDNNSGIIREE